jgi:hypothetical protein
MKEAMWTKKIRRTCRRVALDSHALDRSLVTPQTLASFMHVWETQCKCIGQITPLWICWGDDPWPVPVPCFSAAMFNLVLLFCFAVFEAQQQTQADNLLTPPSQAQWQRGQHNFHLHTSGFESGPLYTRSQGQCSTQIQYSYWSKSWNQPQGLYTRSQGWNRKKLFNLPHVLINAELYGLLLAPRLKQGYHHICEANLQPLGPMFEHLRISWHQCSSIY